MKLVVRILIALVLFVVVFTGLYLNRGEGLLGQWLQPESRALLLVLTSSLYALVLAVPFVPGVELGWMIMGLFGRIGIVAAWLSTVLGLSISYWVARRLSDHPQLQRLHDARDSLMATPKEDLSMSQRFLAAGVCLYEKHPYLFIFVTLNLPGNWLIGGGGGIAATAGIMPKVGYLRFVLTCAVATGIVPVLLWLGLANIPVNQ
ncbi:hypothetical protein NFC81_10915 [Salinispirillum sp. LH 10-3-1]|uniref:TVP38/TMEM64 family membrane protein n=1 Tax=Salinispirillum sp. LH 10-3-1 TaxID=2952525 RepID=A0AB38YCX6_9GAMM